MKKIYMRRILYINLFLLVWAGTVSCATLYTSDGRPVLLSLYSLYEGEQPPSRQWLTLNQRLLSDLSARLSDEGVQVRIITNPDQYREFQMSDLIVVRIENFSPVDVDSYELSVNYTFKHSSSALFSETMSSSGRGSAWKDDLRRFHRAIARSTLESLYSLYHTGRK